MQNIFWYHGWVLCVISALQRKGVRAQVPGAVQIDPQNKIVDDLLEALGIDSGGDKGPLVDRWYFWLIIAIVILMFIVALYFTVRGFVRYARNRKEVCVDVYMHVYTVVGHHSQPRDSCVESDEFCV